MRLITKLLLIFSFALLLTNCTEPPKTVRLGIDDCGYYESYETEETTYYTAEQLRKRSEEKGVFTSVAQPLQNPGKIYLIGDYIFIAETGKGIHVINNIDPKNPKSSHFINLLGNVDMAIRGPMLYADSYTDLLAIDISDISNPKVIHRQKNAFDVYNVHTMWEKLEPSEVVTGRKTVTKQRYVSCDLPVRGGAVASGTGGSMARFAIVEDYLYTIDNIHLGVYQIDRPERLKHIEHQEVDFDIETIFPYKDRLFIGGMNGMYIYSIKDLSSPLFLGSFSHVRSCDPVVVNDTLAFVTLSSDKDWGRRQSNGCLWGEDKLEVIDISNPASPELAEETVMHNPKGLGLYGEHLYVCDGSEGLKVMTFGAKEDAFGPYYGLDQIAHFADIQTYDVIPVAGQNRLILTGPDGLWQFDISSPETPQVISKIPINSNKHLGVNQ